MRTPSPYLIRPDGEDMIVVPYMRYVSMRGDPEMAVMGGGVTKGNSCIFIWFPDQRTSAPVGKVHVY